MHTRKVHTTHDSSTTPAFRRPAHPGPHPAVRPLNLARTEAHTSAHSVPRKSTPRTHTAPVSARSVPDPSAASKHPAKTLKPISVAFNNSRAAAAVKAAYAALGTPYRWGGTSANGYDCSGLTQHVWHVAGVKIPRTSSQQAVHGKAVSLATISPGDLVIFYRGASHVGIYVGGGMVIDAPHTGAFVRLERMRSMPIYDIRRYS